MAHAAVSGPLKVMAPMVSVPAEMAAFRAPFEAELKGAGIEAAAPPLGMMVEVPAAALTAGAFEADFLSVGSKDLIQDVMAASRDDAAVAPLDDPRSPAVLELIRAWWRLGRRAGSRCRYAARWRPTLTSCRCSWQTGPRRLSVGAAALGPVKAALAAAGTRGDG